MQKCKNSEILKAAQSVTFDLLIFEIMILFFKNTVKKLKCMYTFYQFRKSKQIISIKTTAFMLQLTVYNYWRDANNYQQEKRHLYYKIIHFSMQFSATVNRFIVKT